MQSKRNHWIAVAVSALNIISAQATWTPSHAQTLDRIRGSGVVKFGYDPDARPFSFTNDRGGPDGYSVELCNRIADNLKAVGKIPQLNVEWVALAVEAQARAVQDGVVDLFCSAEPVTLSRRQEVSFSLPIFPSGTGAVLNTSAPLALREVLEFGQPAARPVWRGSPARTVLEHKTFSAITGSASEHWLNERINTFQLAATVRPVEDYQQGIQDVVDGSTSVLFGEMPRLMDASARTENPGNLVVLKRHFTYEPLALELGRADEDFRLAVDRALSETYRSPDFRQFFITWFGPPDEAMVTFFQQTALPD